jgi:hypothetical protein
MASDILVFGSPPVDNIAAFTSALNAPALKPLREFAQSPWPQMLKYHSSFLRSFDLIRYVLCEEASTAGILSAQAATFQGGLAAAWYDASDNATAAHVSNCAEVLTSSAFTDGARHDTIVTNMDVWFAAQGLTDHLAYSSQCDG